jgi:acyl dehydratase
MPTYLAQAALPDGAPGPWGAPVDIRYDPRDVMLYAAGIGTRDLRFVYERDPGFAVFPTFAIRWGSAGAPIDHTLIPPSPGPLNIDAERDLELLHPLPLSGTVQVRSRLIAAHPRGKGNAFVETESLVTDSEGRTCVRMVNGSFRRGIATLGDIEPFEGSGQTLSQRLDAPARAADLETSARIADNQAHIYRLSGDYNPLHIEPAAAQFGGFPSPILHGLCTYGHCAHLLLDALCAGDPRRFSRLRVRFASPVYPGDVLVVRAWHDGPGRVIFNALVNDKVVVSNAFFEFKENV